MKDPKAFKPGKQEKVKAPAKQEKEKEKLVKASVEEVKGSPEPTKSSAEPKEQRKSNFKLLFVNVHFLYSEY